jgi:hypothetical protein
MKPKTVAILQSNYIPWKGYFSIIKASDLFIFHDDLQYTKQDWRNRNTIKTSSGLKWLTIPCGSNEHRQICDVTIPDNSWQKNHWNCIYDAYHKAPYFKRYSSFFEKIYLDIRWHDLSAFNQYIIQYIAREYLNITTQFDDSRVYNLKETKEKRVLELLKATKATDYVSGPAAKSYIHEDFFSKQGITVHWMNYNQYKIYNQFHTPFEHKVSVIDLLFHVGPKAKNYL